MISPFVVIALFIIAMCIFLGFMHGMNLRPLVMTYWFLVAVKNLLEWMGK